MSNPNPDQINKYFSQILEKYILKIFFQIVNKLLKKLKIL